MTPPPTSKAPAKSAMPPAPPVLGSVPPPSPSVVAVVVAVGVMVVVGVVPVVAVGGAVSTQVVTLSPVSGSVVVVQPEIERLSSGRSSRNQVKEKVRRRREY